MYCDRSTLARVVLPKPAGAEMSVNRDSAPRLKRSLSRGRTTRLWRTLGM